MEDSRFVRVIAPLDEAQYETFDAAIASLKTEPRSIRAANDSKVIHDATIVDGHFDDTSVTLFLSNNRTLRIFLVGGIVCWEITSLSSIDGTSGGGSNIPLELRFGSTQQTYQWDRSQLLHTLVGARLERLSAGSAWVFLDVALRPTLLFMRLIRIEDESDLLFFDPE